MATTKKRTSKRKSAKESSMLLEDSEMNASSVLSVEPKPKKNRMIKIAIAIILLAVVLGLLAKRYKSAFLVATVNGSPVLRSELNKRLTDRFGSQMLEAVIGERLITQEAAKQNIAVSDAEVKSRIGDVEKTITGGMSLDDTLKMQGITRSEFENQIRIQIMIDKMFGKDASATPTEIDDYIKSNAATLTASGDAEKRVEAEKEVKNQKISQKFVEWFNKVKQSAKIDRFL